MVMLIAAAVLLLAARRPAPAPTPTGSATAPGVATNRALAIATDPQSLPIAARPEGPVSHWPTPDPNSTLEASQGGLEGSRPHRVDAALLNPTPDSPSGRLSVEEEQRIGREVHELITARHKVLKNDPLRHRLERAVAPLTAQRPGNQPPLQFTLLDSDESFAFAHLGGYLYASRGLFHLVRNDAELRFILGCEIAHLDLGHLARAAVITNRDDATTTPARRLYRQIAVGYNPDDVFAADAWSYRTLRRLGLPGYQTIAWLSPSANLEGAEDPRGSRRSPATSPESDLQEIENHWRSLPPAAERYHRLLALDGGDRVPPGVALRRPSH
jgi:hypothetical protein